MCLPAPRTPGHLIAASMPRTIVCAMFAFLTLSVGTAIISNKDGRTNPVLPGGVAEAPRSTVTIGAEYIKPPLGHALSSACSFPCLTSTNRHS